MAMVIPAAASARKGHLLPPREWSWLTRLWSSGSRSAGEKRGQPLLEGRKGQELVDEAPPHRRPVRVKTPDRFRRVLFIDHQVLEGQDPSRVRRRRQHLDREAPGQQRVS